MATESILVIVMFLSSMGLLILGFPVAFTLGGSAILFAGIGVVLGVFDFSLIGAVPQRVFGIMSTNVLIAVPLFIFMGVMLHRSNVAEDLLVNISQLFGRVRGGLGLAVTIVGMLLAASTGVIGATVVTLGLMSLPVMLKYKYDVRLASGTICAAGTLGQIIPPSLVLVFLGDFLGFANQQAQFTTLNFDSGSVGVVELFAGALIPGLVLVSLYLVYQLIVGWLRPEMSPAVPRPADAPTGMAALESLLISVAAPLGLIVAVLGSILAGIATPTEAAAVGATGAIFLASARGSVSSRRDFLPYYMAGIATVGLIVLSQTVDLRPGREIIPIADMIAIVVAGLLILALAWGFSVSLWRVWRSGVLTESAQDTGRITSMVFTILIGATIFTLMFRGFGGDDLVNSWLTGLPGGKYGALAVVMLVMFLLGFFLDILEIMFVVIPVVAPPLLIMGFDPIWLGIMMALNLQTSFLTPPFGFALFYFRGVAPPEVRTIDIYKGVIPFIAIQIFALLLLVLFPQMATWLPKAMFG